MLNFDQNILTNKVVSNKNARIKIKYQVKKIVCYRVGLELKGVGYPR